MYELRTTTGVLIARSRSQESLVDWAVAYRQVFDGDLYVTYVSPTPADKEG